MTTGNAIPEDMTDDELEAAQRAADGEAAGTNPALDTDDKTGEDAAAAATAAAAAVEQGADTTTTEAAAATAAGAEVNADDTQPAGKVEGIASKDGSRILPYAALQAERRAARHATAMYTSTARELEDAKKLIADMKAGKVPDAGVTEADVAQMEEDFPEQGKKMRALFTRQQELEAAQPAKVHKQPDVSDDPVQEAIDLVPLLVEWQHGDAEKFQRAQELDAALVNSPKWRDKPVHERFEHVTKLVADEFDIAIPGATKASTTPAKAPSPDPKTVAAQAPRAAPNTLSDFKGGAVADHGTENFSKMSSRSMLARFSEMSDEEMDAHLAKLG